MIPLYPRNRDIFLSKIHLYKVVKTRQVQTNASRPLVSPGAGAARRGRGRRANCPLVFRPPYIKLGCNKEVCSFENAIHHFAHHTPQEIRFRGDCEKKSEVRTYAAITEIAVTIIEFATGTRVETHNDRIQIL
ncbi:hypothetical protein EVAR_36070_1 [Eumeta japonica]|uniref:Uncharacterized protein n=1 Tax=Eumeta variegata TaxID=151549 RepID=A0A4C1ZES5_EUMVA|nr:hypothetical protein EVAR_36070_1 [Eumeta japonica]